jgi:hypothetical protein
MSQAVAGEKIMANDQFERFGALHVPGDPLILFNIWDAGSAQAVAKSGAKAIATGSASVAMANGFGDGQQMPMDFALANAKRIMDAVEVPVTVDFEGAYSADPAVGAHNIAQLAETGAVGCNFEDQVVGARGCTPSSCRLRGSRPPGLRLVPSFSSMSGRTCSSRLRKRRTTMRCSTRRSPGSAPMPTRGERLLRADAG